MESDSLNLLDKHRMTKQLSKSLDARILDFGMIDRCRSIKKEDITIDVEESVEGMNEVEFVDEEITRLVAGLEDGVDLGCAC